MNQNESIQDMQKRFTHIINHLASLGKVFPNKDPSYSKNFKKGAPSSKPYSKEKE
uniref:Uncharacterized protein n=2 Tax=Cajanus cajan TaxID=3821 RepID=A0A151QWS4_CAJCA|nr:hypothetical protein KK1_044212 [Cajanus cajan]